MHTTCPECRTSFRVSQDQLGLRRGLVRCGKCNAVFNAYDALLPELQEPPIPPPQPQPDALSNRLPADEPVLTEGQAPGEYPGHPYPEAPSPSADPTGNDSTEDPVEPWASSQPESPEPPEPELDPTPDSTGGQADPIPEPVLPADEAPAEAPPLVEAPGEETAGAPPRETDSPESILLSELPTRLPGKPGLPTGKKVAYGLAILLLILLLLTQLALLLRAELAASLPATRPLLRQLCAPLGCVVPLPRQLDRQAIAASNLEHDPEQKSRVRLTFLLANRTGQAQTWPQVVLTLTDVRESPVAQKVFLPDAYLPKDTDLAAGMAAGQEREVRLDLDIGNLAATGYALALAYP